MNKMKPWFEISADSDTNRDRIRIVRTEAESTVLNQYRSYTMFVSTDTG